MVNCVTTKQTIRSSRWDLFLIVTHPALKVLGYYRVPLRGVLEFTIYDGPFTIEDSAGENQ